MDSNLANLIRPKILEDFICPQEQKKLFQKIIENNDYRSFIFYGKPGTGKTTISYILANALKVNYEYFNAAIENKEDLVHKLKLNKILIIDEIHRLNKDKQDILLPYLENDLITIYATTTENPYFKLNPALRSRCSIIEITKPTIQDLSSCLKNACIKTFGVDLNKDIADYLALQANGDFRSALNNLDLIMLIFKDQEFSLEAIKKIIPSIQFSSDESGDNHYDYLSAFHKSLRGSDIDAALYWGFIIIKSGDFDGLFRRMLCASYEDVGMANPKLGSEVLSAIECFERIGMPEGYLPITQAILNICLSPKSKTVYSSSTLIKSIIDSGNIFEVPIHLKDAHYKSAAKLKRGLNYKYPHDYKNNYIDQQYLPNELKDKIHIELNGQGYEQKIKQYWDLIKNKGEK
ncbi:replication-associated recombination protein A [Metamycoplasma hominis]|uniref:replication-associated recombination protein A n=1 Tax=Metamycoplasma hominis TaxID=2098 RepID=UPI00064025BB|nr:replication-associated recombination protein A [Metamycoplasma hominis]AKJ52395.1 replication-associated recombination protein A [Metamycoplasma hominis]